MANFPWQGFWLVTIWKVSPTLRKVLLILHTGKKVASRSSWHWDINLVNWVTNLWAQFFLDWGYKGLEAIFFYREFYKFGGLVGRNKVGFGKHIGKKKG